MSLFVVVRMGVYDQGVVDVVETLTAARASAERAAERENDLYHSFAVRQRGDDGEFDETVLTLVSPHNRRYPEKGKRGSRVWMAGAE